MNPSDSSPDQSLTDADIAACAYLIWLNEGQPEGRTAEHWAQAESQLRASQAHDGWTDGAQRRI